MSVFQGEYVVFRATLFAFFLLVGVAGLTGNAAVCHTFRKHSLLRTVTNLIIINAAITALLHCLFNIPPSLAYLALNKLPPDDRFCQFNGFMNSVCLFESMFSLLVLSGSRYWCILRPTTFQSIFSKRRTLLVLCSTWFLAIALSSPALIGWSKFRPRPEKMMCVSMWKNSLSYTIFTTLTVFIIPSFVIIAIYYKIYKHIKSHEELLKLYTIVSVSQETRQKFKNHSKSVFKDYQVTKLIWTLFIIFVASWFPYFVANLIVEFLGSDVPRVLDGMLILTTQFNTTCSPIIYGLVNRQFRKGFWEIICCSRKPGQKSNGKRRRWTRNNVAESTDMRSSLRTYQQTSRGHAHELNTTEVTPFCITTV